MADNIEADQARVNVTYGGTNGDLPDLVQFDATDGDIKTWVTEAVRGGGIPGIAVAPNADFTDFVVDRFAATGDLPNRLMVRPKTPFGTIVEELRKVDPRILQGVAGVSFDSLLILAFLSLR